MSGGEPLSEDLEKLVSETARKVYECEMEPGKYNVRSILRAFAREIQDEQEERIRSAAGAFVLEERKDYAVRTAEAEALLLASQEQAKALAEALEKALAGGELLRRTSLPPHDVSGTAMWQEGVKALAEVRTVLAAHRASECIPCRKGEDHLKGVAYPCGRASEAGRKP